MNIRSKILLSTAAGAAVTALTLAAIVALNIKSVAAIAAVASAFCAIAVVIGLYIANSVAKTLDAAGDIKEAARRLAEIFSMTNRNAGIIHKVKLSATEAFAAASVGDAAMNRVAKAVNWIKASSDQNTKIIKMVNHIAARANLLAINAAIDAARTGEAGSGFAATANEMRNFAIRCSMASKNIADMIEESAKEADDGVKLAESAVKYINTVVDRTDSLDRLIDKIVEASCEQTKEILLAKTAAARTNTSLRRNAASDAPTGIAEKPESQPPELADAEPCAADQREQRCLPDRKTRYAAFPYQKPFSITTLAFWVPERVEAEEALTIDDFEMWR